MRLSGRTEKYKVKLKNASEPMGVDMRLKEGLVVVEAVKPGSAAARAGFKTPVVVREVNKYAVRSDAELVKIIQSELKKKKLEFKFVVEPLLDPAPPPAAAAAGPAPPPMEGAEGGLAIVGPESNATIALNAPTESLGLDFKRRGALLVCENIKPGAAASRTGLVAPFAICAVDGHRVATEQDVVQAVGGVKKRGGMEFLFTIAPVGPASPPPSPKREGWGREAIYHIKLDGPAESLGLGVKEGPGGTTLMNVSAAAERAGLPSGVTIRSINGVPVPTPMHLTDYVKGAKGQGITDYRVEIVGAPPTPSEMNRTPSNLTRGAEGESVAGDALAVPAMPFFEPEADSAAAALLKKASDGIPSDASEFSFPADVNFWENFVQAQMSEEARQHPVARVSASHEADRALIVNRGFLRAFVRGWEETNPHVVVVSGPDGEKTFHASKEFWNEVVEKLRKDAEGRPPPPPGTGVSIKSNLIPDMPAVHASTEDWNQACTQWEEKKQITPEQRKEKIEKRRVKFEMDQQKKAEMPPAPPPAPAP
eukprot:Hpha_TRINITY_DN28651_c0_g1::TRINITY_DN28651_c0_g1_i1::g.156379::m.156379